MFQRFERAVADPFFNVFRKDPFFSPDFVGGLSDLSFFAAGDFVPENFLGGGLSEPLIDEAALMGFRDRFWLAALSLETGIDENPSGFSSPESVTGVGMNVELELETSSG